MIVKLLGRHSRSYESLIRYILRDDAFDQETGIITHNLKASPDMKGYVSQFCENESFRKQNRKGQVYLYHTILSFHTEEDKDIFTPDMLRDISQKYISLHGNKGMYIGGVHRDKGHVHLHFCLSSLHYRTGTNMRLSYRALKELKLSLQEYQRKRYPMLSKSLPVHGQGKGYKTDRQWYAEHKEKRTAIKSEISQMVRECLTRAESQEEFIALLNEQGLHHYERGPTLQGVMKDDLKFRFSRLDIPHDLLKTLPRDLTEEQKAIREIEAIRQSRREHDYAHTR